MRLPGAGFHGLDKTEEINDLSFGHGGIDRVQAIDTKMP
jgi:hypothetical protein